MTREELIQALAARIDVPPHNAQVFLHACFDIVKSLLRAGEDVTLQDLGHWTAGLKSGGILTSVKYSASVSGIAEGTEEVLLGPASSIDAMHFIPAAALEIAHTAQRASFDIAALVAEVRESLSPSVIVRSTIDERAAEKGVPENSESEPMLEQPVLEQPMLEQPMLEQPMLEQPMLEQPMLEQPVLEQPMHEQPMLEQPVLEQPMLKQTMLEQPMLKQTVPDSDEDRLLEAEMEAEGYEIQAPHSQAETGMSFGDESDIALAAFRNASDKDPLSDDEVFHRNRNQLYHPPEKPGNRPLLITAAILTFCVLVIIVYMLLDHNEPRELPGSAPVGVLLDD
ncbi:MAG: HU family DNA-binding protein [Bacteroidota bacterium]|jgi:hypothetical protein